MTSALIPSSAWSWRRTSVIVLVILVPALGVGTMASSRTFVVDAAATDAMIVWPAALVAACACYASWWLHPRPAAAWGTIGLAALGFQELVRAAVQLVDADHAPGSRLLVAELLAVLGVAMVVAVAHRLVPRADPAFVGFGLGAVVAACRMVAIDAQPRWGHRLDAGWISIVYVSAAVVVAALLSWGGGLTAHIGSIPRWARQRAALSVLCIAVAHVSIDGADTLPARALVLVADTTGAVLVVSTFVALYVLDVEATRQSRNNLVEELERTRRDHRASRATMHEITATIAGITSASELLRSNRAINPQRRGMLQDMVAGELGRLERLMTPADTETHDGVTDLDATIGPLVVSQEVRGRRVSWVPCGLRAAARPDAIAEIVNVLLENAARHGHATAEVSASRKGDVVEITVHDDGPGVDPALGERVFEWGVHGPRSTGQGIGLNAARRRAVEQGGYLRLVHDKWGGATFVVGLPLEARVLDRPRPVDGDGSSLTRG